MIIAAFVVLLATVSPAMPVEPDVTGPLETRALMLSMPRPQYPEEALTNISLDQAGASSYLP
jgi:hypothetical protein